MGTADQEKEFLKTQISKYYVWYRFLPKKQKQKEENNIEQCSPSSIIVVFYQELSVS